MGKSAGINFTHHNGAEGYRLLFETMSAGTAFFDYDNDDYLDLYIVSSANTSGNILMRNNGDGTFSDVTDAAGVGNTDFGMGVCVADYDNDGDVDIFIVNNNHPATLLRNDMGNSHHWLMLRTIGTRSNRDGIGARVELVAGNTRIVEEVRSGAGYLSGRDTRLHFGLGSHSYADRLTIRWPSGILQEMKNVPSNQVLVITEPAN